MAINFEISGKIEELNQAIRALGDYRMDESNSPQMLEDLGERVNLHARAAYSKYTDIYLWKGDINGDDFKAVGQALVEAFACLPEIDHGPKAKYSVRASAKERIIDFIDFSARVMQGQSESKLATMLK